MPQNTGTYPSFCLRVSYEAHTVQRILVESINAISARQDVGLWNCSCSEFELCLTNLVGAWEAAVQVKVELIALHIFALHRTDLLNQN